MKIRAARAGEAERLTALCCRSKAYWGYDAKFMAQAAAALTITEPMIAQGLFLVAEGANEFLLGVAAVSPLGAREKFELSFLFVEPSVIGTGVGRALFSSAVDLVGGKGGTTLTILADPFAAGFYRRLGAIQVGQAPSDAIPGRWIPLFEYRI